MRAIDCVLFDLGDTLIHEFVDDDYRLDEVTLRTMPRAKESLESLHVRYRICLVTNTETSSEVSVRRALGRLGLEKFLNAVVTSVDLGVRKPDERMFREALRRINARPSNAAMVGNDPICDIFGAKRLGILTILYTGARRYSRSERLSADYCVSNLNQVPAVLASVQERSE